MAVVRSNEELNKYAESKAPLTGTGASGTWEISVTGNAATATKLATARTINGVSFDGSANIAIPFANLSTTPTTVAGYGITDVYTKTQTDANISTAVAGLVNGSPAALDTLNELATALGNDANFATTVSTSIGTKVTKNADIVGGTNTKITYDAKGLVTGGTSLAAIDIPALDWSKITTGKPTTLSGYGISDAVPSSHIGTTGASHGVATTSVNGFMSSTDKTKLDGVATNANNYVHPTSGVVAGTYTKITVDANGHATAGSTPTTLAGYSIGDAYTKTSTDSLIDIHSKTEKTTLVDADEFMTADSTSTFSLKKITWASIKTLLANLFIPKVTSTDNAIVRFDGTTGEVQDSKVVISDNGYINANGTSSGEHAFKPNTTSELVRVSATASDYSSLPSWTSTSIFQYGSTATGNFLGSIPNANLGALFSQNIANMIIGNNSSAPLIFVNGSTEKMRIDISGNVGIGTSSPANSKFNRTFTTQVTGASSVAITAGDYSSGASSIVTAIESLGARGDANTTFGGRFGASYRRTNGEVIPFGTSIGYYAFGGQWGTDVGYVPSKHLYTASICGVAEGAFTSSTAMATGISFRTGSTGESLGNVNTTYGTERMRIDSSGNVLLTSATGGLGYGAGAGGTVTQLTSKSTAITLNKPCGTIIMNDAALAAGMQVQFNLFNSLVSSTDTVELTLKTSSSAVPMLIELTWAIENGIVQIGVRNNYSVSLSETLAINFTVIKGANS